MNQTTHALAREPREQREVSPRPVVYIVDGDIFAREALEELVGDEGWRAESFASASAFLARQRPLVPGCLVLDVSLPDSNGLDVQERLIECTHIPIIFVTCDGDVETSVRAMKAGAVEFLLKPYADEVLREGMRHAITRSGASVREQLALRTMRANYAQLSPREQQVMVLVTSGLLNKQVGAELGISELTVKAHRCQVMRKMRAPSFADLVRAASTLNLCQ